MNTKPNIENLTALAEWFEAGAPEWRFDMKSGMVLKTTPEGGVLMNECGSAGCIAGAADAMRVRQMADDEVKAHYKSIGVFPTDAGLSFCYEGIRDSALQFLGLPRRPGFVGHDLFDEYLAPRNCTTEQAAAAIRRVIAGDDPWPEQTET